MRNVKIVLHLSSEKSQPALKTWHLKSDLLWLIVMACQPIKGYLMPKIKELHSLYLTIYIFGLII